ncbi:MAG: hypothetical protein ABI400_15200, partial [Lacisediminihabitans sp.]
PWPSFEGLSVSRVAEGLGVESLRIDGYAELTETLNRVLPTLASRSEPLVIEITIAPEQTYAS